MIFMLNLDHLLTDSGSNSCLGLLYLQEYGLRSNYNKLERLADRQDLLKAYNHFSIKYEQKTEKSYKS